MRQTGPLVQVTLERPNTRSWWWRIRRIGMVLYHYLKGRKFQHFGWKSYLGKCDQLTNPRAIQIGAGTTIQKRARLEALGPWDGRTPKITIGADCTIMYDFHCGAVQSVQIGNDVWIAARVYISDHDHVFDDPERPPSKCRELTLAPVRIGDGVWLGEGCVILKGVSVGTRAVVGANAVVTRDVPPYTVVAGVPAKVLRSFGPVPKENHSGDGGNPDVQNHDDLGDTPQPQQTPPARA